MGRPSRGGRGGRKRPSQSQSSEQDSRKPKKHDTAQEAEDVEMKEEDRAIEHQVEIQPSTTQEMHTPYQSPPRSGDSRLIHTPGPKPDGTHEYFERGIMDVSAPTVDYDSDDSPPPPSQTVNKEIHDLIQLIRDPGVAKPIPSSNSHRVAEVKAEQPQSTATTFDQLPPPPTVDLDEQYVTMMNQDQESGAAKLAEHDSGHWTTKTEAENQEFDTSRAVGQGQDVCGHQERLTTPSPTPSVASQAPPPAPPPTPVTPVVHIHIIRPGFVTPVGQRKGERRRGVPPTEPQPEQAGDATAELPHANTEAELERIKETCRQMFEHEWQFTGDKKSQQPITPYHWTEFRKRIIMDGELRIDGQQLLRVETTENGLGIIIYQTSTSKPICSLPSCFSTDGTTTRPNTRCAKHHGNATSFAVMELVFHEEVLGRTVAIGVEHVILMFSHYQNDPEVELKRRSVEEYSTSGLLDETVRRLKKKKLKRSAKELKTTRAATVRRQWIFRNLQLACNNFYVMAMACCMVYRTLGTSRTPPIGYFRGHHVEYITRNFYLEGKVPQSTEVMLYNEIDLEQTRTYGVTTPIESVMYGLLHYTDPHTQCVASSFRG